MEVNTDGIVIRELRKDDAAIIEFIKNRQSESWLYTKQEIEDMYINQSLAGKSPYIYIALNSAGEYVGQVFLDYNEDGFMNIKNEFWVNALYVKEAWRNQGIARKLLQTIEDKCKSLGHTALYLDTISTERYYKHIGGWETIGTDIWERGNETMIIMRKQLH